MGRCRRLSGCRPELPVPLVGPSRGDRVQTVAPRVGPYARAGGGPLLSIRAPAGSPAAAVYRFRLRRRPGAGAGVRLEDPLHSRPRDVPQLGYCLCPWLRPALDSRLDLAMARLADGPRGGADRRWRLPPALLRPP